MANQPEGDKRAEHRDPPPSRSLQFFARQLSEHGELVKTKQYEALLAKSVNRLRDGDYDGSHLAIQLAAKELLKQPILTSETTSLLKTSLRLLADEHLRKDAPVGALGAIDMLLELARKEIGPNRGEITTLSFERVLTLKVIRERQGATNPELNESYLRAISETRAMALREESGITNTVRGHILSHLGKCLFYAGAWGEADSTLLRSLEFVTAPAAKAIALKMLAQIAHHQGEQDRARSYVRALALIPGWHDPEHASLAEQVERGALPAGDATIPPTLQCINETLTRGYSLLQQERFVAAQSTLEGALAMIEHQYGPRHYLATTALTLLCKAVADQASLSDDEAEQQKLFAEARAHALRGFDILQSESADRPRQKQLLEFARDISDALDDQSEVERLSRMIESDLF